MVFTFILACGNRTVVCTKTRAVTVTWLTCCQNHICMWNVWYILPNTLLSY